MIYDEIIITNMPPVLQSDLDNYENEQVENMLLLFKQDVLDVAYYDIEDILLLHSIYDKIVFMSTKVLGDHEYWDGIYMFSRVTCNQNQHIWKIRKH